MVFISIGLILALSTNYMYLLLGVIGSLSCLPLFVIGHRDYHGFSL